MTDNTNEVEVYGLEELFALPKADLNKKVEPLGYRYTFELYDEIGEPSDYTDLIQTLKGAGPNDMIHLRINSPGGRKDATLSILDAIRFCEGTVVAEAEGYVMSAASILFFGCDAFTVNPHAEFLIHNGFSGERGKPNDNLASAKHTMKSMKQLFTQVYGRYLTKKEVAAVIEGKELFLLGNEVEARIEKYMKKRAKDQGE